MHSSSFAGCFSLLEDYPGSPNAPPRPVPTARGRRLAVGARTTVGRGSKSRSAWPNGSPLRINYNAIKIEGL